jgi:hypothetical protein
LEKVDNRAFFIVVEKQQRRKEALISASLLCHAFGIRGYQCVNAKYNGGEVIYTIRKRKTDLCFPECTSRKVVCNGSVERTFSAAPIVDSLVKNRNFDLSVL